VGDLHYNPWTDNTYTGMVKRNMPTWGSLASKLGGKKKNEDEPAKPKRGDDVIITIYQKPN
jgi:hypothetical protein